MALTRRKFRPGPWEARAGIEMWEVSMARSDLDSDFLALQAMEFEWAGTTRKVESGGNVPDLVVWRGRNSLEDLRFLKRMPRRAEGSERQPNSRASRCSNGLALVVDG